MAVVNLNRALGDGECQANATGGQAVVSNTVTTDNVDYRDTQGQIFGLCIFLFRSLPASTSSLTSTRIVHRLAVELRTVWPWGCATRWQRTPVAPPIVEIMINVSVEALRPVKIWARADEYSAREPFRAIVTIWGAVVGRDLVISIRADGCAGDTDGYVTGTARHEGRGGNNQENTEVSWCTHNSSPAMKIMQMARTFQTPPDYTVFRRNGFTIRQRSCATQVTAVSGTIERCGLPAQVLVAKLMCYQ